MNKWKIAFWCCFILLLLLAGFTLYSIIDGGVSLTHQKEAYKDTENDLGQIIKIINKTDFSKIQIENELKDHHLYEFMDFKTDTISLDRVLLVFSESKLKMVTKQW